MTSSWARVCSWVLAQPVDRWWPAAECIAGAPAPKATAYGCLQRLGRFGVVIASAQGSARRFRRVLDALPVRGSGGGHGSLWRPEDDGLLADDLAEGVPLEIIAETLDRSRASIDARIRTLGLRRPWRDHDGWPLPSEVEGRFEDVDPLTLARELGRLRSPPRLAVGGMGTAASLCVDFA
ncbi:hypothetical protein [Zavarzinia compransoris]|uniref:Uncharacterized protein n=1 Tax=Zavarzinia compransoris TaxID=1264899 RepID=A0A317EAW4_9PROT|nr:hypothetical protein [Zavarzinia compransoris]PWR23376.1 hypothetical protein DKG75_02060 [Zavarzinia compransoris]